MRADLTDEVGRGPLSELALWVYRAVMLEIALLIGLVPTVVAWSFLAPDPSNVWLYALAAIFVAPALSAGLYARRAWSSERDQSPARALWRGYRQGFVPVVRWWGPTLLLAAVLVFNISYADYVAGGPALRPAAILLLAVLAVWSGHMLVVTTFFSFRLRDAARVALACLSGCWRASLGVVALLVSTAGLAVLGGDILVLLLAFALLLLAWPGTRAVIDFVTETFTHHG